MSVRIVVRALHSVQPARLPNSSKPSKLVDLPDTQPRNGVGSEEMDDVVPGDENH